MTVLVLGGAGFIGRAVVQSLGAAGLPLRVLDRHARPPTMFDPPLDVDWRAGVLADRHLLAEALQDARAVVHLASPASPALADADWKADVEAQVIDSIRVIEAMGTAGVRRLVFMSSGGTVYGGNHHAPIDEQQATVPISTYGINKLAVEHFIGHARAAGKVDPVILRAANAYGPGQATDKAQGLIGTCIVRALAGEPLRIWGDGLTVRDFVYVDDIARAVRAAIPYEGRHTVFNIGSGIGRTVREVIATIETLGRIPVRIEYLPARGLDVPFNVLDRRRAHVELGWEPEISFERGLATTIAWYREHC